ncbi:uncharacterized protein LOC129739457 [Uranotaenia lowii]|uniref:uncharacterized protein LOC129739457 n=1 Tax=Uranotaenia lowii TaxID=190385 RepID=UPI002478FC70|nr:uncharacterized protein LOC129739457 [Uranotaenia lowii]
MLSGRNVCMGLLGLATLLLAVQAHPMFYKKVDGGQKYEPDWVPVSSTVIPLAEYQLSVGGGSKSAASSSGGQTAASIATVASFSEEYKRAYLRHKKLHAAAIASEKAKASVTEKGAGSPETAAARVQEDPDTLITAKKLYAKKV